MYALRITLLTRMYDCVRGWGGGGGGAWGVGRDISRNVERYCLAIYRAMSQAVYN